MKDRETIIVELKSIANWHSYIPDPFHYEFAKTIYDAIKLLLEDNRREEIAEEYDELNEVEND